MDTQIVSCFWNFVTYSPWHIRSWSARLKEWIVDRPWWRWTWTKRRMPHHWKALLITYTRKLLLRNFGRVGRRGYVFCGWKSTRFTLLHKSLDGYTYVTYRKVVFSCSSICILFNSIAIKHNLIRSTQIHTKVIILFGF